MPSCDFNARISPEDCGCRDCREIIQMRKNTKCEIVKLILNNKSTIYADYVNPEYFTEGEPDEFLIMRDEDEKSQEDACNEYGCSCGECPEAK